LDEDLPEQPEDKTVPKYRQIHKVRLHPIRSLWLDSTVTNSSKRAGEYVLDWAGELEKHYAKIAAPGPKSTLAKRTAKDRAAETEDGAAKPSKRIKAEATPSGIDDEVHHHYQKGTVAKVRRFFLYAYDAYGFDVLTCLPHLQLTVALLKEFLTSHGRSAAGKKADLVERVEEYFDRK
jgi:ATP-dependent DNA helicase 2 subunit 1